MFEHRTHPLLTRRQFFLRLLRMAAIALAVVAGGLGIGVVGYHVTEDLPWIDALLDASMILFGMGPVHPLTTTAGKLFASFYAMFAGLVFVAVSAVLFAPLFHRMIHMFHLQLTDDDDDPATPQPPQATERSSARHDPAASRGERRGPADRSRP